MILDTRKVRRLGCEQAIARMGYTSMKECTMACQEYADRNNIDCTFNPKAISHFVGGLNDMSTKRVTILMAVLGVTSLQEITERFTAPDTRGCGQLWTGEFGAVVVDYDSTQLLKSMKADCS